MNEKVNFNILTADDLREIVFIDVSYPEAPSQISLFQYKDDKTNLIVNLSHFGQVKI